MNANPINDSNVTDTPYYNTALNDLSAIPYQRRYRSFCKSVTATILFQQIMYRWKKNGEKPFYKFISPCGHKAYKKGDSWQEELGFSLREFESAIKRIAVKKKSSDKLEDLLMDNVIVYWNTQDRMTYYVFNKFIADKLIKKAIDEEKAGQRSNNYVNNPYLLKTQIANLHLVGYENDNSADRLYTENTTKSNYIESNLESSIKEEKEEKGGTNEQVRLKQLKKEKEENLIKEEKEVPSEINIKKVDRDTYWIEAELVINSKGGRKVREAMRSLSSIEISREEFVESYISFAYSNDYDITSTFCNGMKKHALNALKNGFSKKAKVQMKSKGVEASYSQEEDWADQIHEICLAVWNDKRYSYSVMGSGNPRPIEWLGHQKEALKKGFISGIFDFNKMYLYVRLMQFLYSPSEFPNGTNFAHMGAEYWKDFYKNYNKAITTLMKMGESENPKAKEKFSKMYEFYQDNKQTLAKYEK